MATAELFGPLISLHAVESDEDALRVAYQMWELLLPGIVRADRHDRIPVIRTAR
ncbi:hypothetical protein AIIKEEIJ_04006 [Rhodococcus sp. YH1]|nr:hypothetical protein [Rhodococcus sp. YH1]